MKGLSAGEKSLLEFLATCPPSACPGTAPPKEDWWSEEEEETLEALRKRGLVRHMECPCGCGHQHSEVCGDALLVLALDEAAKRNAG